MSLDNSNSKMATKIENSTNQNNINIKDGGDDLLIMNNTGSDMSFISSGGGGAGGDGVAATTVCDENANQKLIDIKNVSSHVEKQMVHDHTVKLKMMNDMIVKNNNSNNNVKNNNNNNKNNILVPIKQKIPKNILMGSVQLVLSIVLVALGCLVLAREASLANAGSGLWAGAVCAVAGSLGIINIQRAQTAFLAVSLVCVASSTLAIAITGIGVVRDSYTTVTDKTTSAVTAGAGLLFILTVHFFVSVFSVYHQTLKLCTRQLTNDDVDANAVGNNTMLTQKKVEEYIKSLTQQQKQGIYNNATIISNEKLMNLPYKTIDKRSTIDNLSNFTYPGLGPYPVMLVPASANTKPIQMVPIFPPPQFVPIQPMPGYISADMQMAYPPEFRMRTTKPSKKHQNKERERRTAKKRRRSEGDILNNQHNQQIANNREALVYHGLDRTIADDFLAQQEKNNNSLQMQLDDSANECYDSKRDVAL